MNKSEHLDWCKSRAFGYIENNDNKGAIASFLSDMGKHPETANHKAIDLMMSMMMSGALNDNNQLKKFIDGFN